eukprot:SRR837773.4469.p3 GENE.SRR837773.4469~~SRR837773.4469.p3  ORF type:complete len:228 (-),score=123.23 SRR837773.4469:86-736(-)
MSPPHIEDLLNGDDRYDVTSLEVLEAHLQEQIDGGSYDLDANLAILKLYLLYVDETKVEVYRDVLLKALLAFPAPDFSLCMYQIPERYHEQLEEVVDLARQLEMATFKTFWTKAATCKRLSEIKGWQAAVQKFIGGVISATCRSIKADEVQELLSVSGGELDKIIKANGWERSKEDKSVLIVNTETFKTKKVEPTGPRNMTLPQYMNLVAASNFAC